MEGKVPAEFSQLEEKKFAKDLVRDLSEDEEEDEAKKKKVNRIATEVVTELCEREAVCLADTTSDESDVLSKTFTVVKHLTSVSHDNKTRLADCLGSNLSVLNATIDANCADLKQKKEKKGAEAEGMPGGDDEEDLRTLRISLKLHVVLLVQILQEATAYGKKYGGADKASKGKKGTKGSSWEWLFVLEKVLRPLACSAGIDMRTLFASSGCPEVKDQLLHKFSSASLVVLNCAGALASSARQNSGSSIRESLMRLVAISSCKIMQAEAESASPVMENANEEEEGANNEDSFSRGQGGLDALLPAFVDAIHKCEQASSILVDASIYASSSLSNAKLGKGLVNELAKVDPRDYRAQQQSDAQGVKNVATFFIDMAERLPSVMTSCLSTVVPHLGGEAYNLRSGIVAVIARILVFHSSNGSSAASHASTGSETFLKSKQHFLKILVERIFDVSAFTRSKTLQAWSYLCQNKAIPIGYWNYITEIAIGRLEDKAALVRKSALQLLATMLQYNPFAPCLPVRKFELSLQEYQEKLQGAREEKKKNAAASDQEEGETTSNQEEQEQVKEEINQDANEEDNEEDDEDPELASLRALVASLDSAVKFCRNLTSSIDVVTQLLASSSITDATETISFIVLLCQFQISGAEEAAGKILPLIFSHEQTVKDAVIDGFAQLYVREGQATEDTLRVASVLSKLVVTLNIGEMASLETIFKSLWSKKILDHSLVDDLLRMLSNPSTDAFSLQGALHLFSLIALTDSDVIVDNLKLILEAGFGKVARKNPYIYRSVCNVLTNLPKGSFVLKNDSPVLGKVVQIIAGKDAHIPSLQWYSVAESCISALYSLSTSPEVTACTILRFMSTLMTVDGTLSVKNTSRFLFVAGQVAVKQLVHVESLGSKVRQKNQSKGTGKGDDDEDDISDQIGAGAAAADAALDNLLEDTEREILYSNNIISLCGPLLHVLCTDKDLMQRHIQLRVAATLALTKLMCLDAKYCEENLHTLFSMLSNKSNESEIRSNIVIALGDLVYRFPNKLEPWTKHIYQILEDDDTKVRKHALMVLSHLILNDMLKVKGHVSSIARLLLDSDKRTASFAELFFHELSRKTATTLYNLIPDILSNLSNDSSLEVDGFRYIMQHILSFIQRDRQTDGLIEKLCHRFDACGENPINCNIAFCISQLNVTEKGLKRLSENFKGYKQIFDNDEVVSLFQVVLAKAKKVVANKANLKAAADDLEQKIKLVVAEFSQEGETQTEEENQQQEDASGNAVGEEDTNDTENCPSAEADAAVPAQKLERDQSPARGAANPPKRERRALRSSSRHNK
jgi:condensin complex subunit 1